MSLTENGVGVADGVRGSMQTHTRPDDAGDAPGVTIEDGFAARNSGRADLYPHAPQRRGASHVLAGRLDEVTAAPASASPQAAASPLAAVASAVAR